MPFLRHCISNKNQSDFVKTILSPILDKYRKNGTDLPEGQIYITDARAAMQNAPGFALSPGATLDDAIKQLENDGQIIRLRDTIYIQPSERKQSA